MPTWQEEQEVRTKQYVRLGTYGVIAFVVLAAGGLAGCPYYNVYSKRMAGQAELAQAESAKKVAIETARAKFESADFEAKAEVRRAEGVRDANKIIADGLGGPEGYLRYLYINNLANTQNQIIYIPTESGLPILEAGKRPVRPQPEAAQ